MSTSALRGPFPGLSALAMGRATTAEQLAAALREAEQMTERHRVAEGMVYAQACDRYLRLTGQPWKQPAEGSASWGESDHRYRERSRHDGSYDAQCSCGAGTVVFTGSQHDGLGPGQVWHAAHVAGRIPGQVPTDA